MKILLTGGAGFIGSAVVRLLINKMKFSVVNVDVLSVSVVDDRAVWCIAVPCIDACVPASDLVK